MEKLKALALSFTLMSVLAVPAFAGETEGPPAPCVPGETQTPPCSSQSLSDGSTAPGQTEAPQASNAVDVIGIAEAALSVLSLV